MGATALQRIVLIHDALQRAYTIYMGTLRMSHSFCRLAVYQRLWHLAQCIS
jgi:hypothetical protein